MKIEVKHQSKERKGIVKKLPDNVLTTKFGSFFNYKWIVRFL